MKKERNPALILTGTILALFSLLVIFGLIYRPHFLDIGAEARTSLPIVQTPHELGIERIHQIIEGDFTEFKLLNGKDAFCQLNIEGKPEEYSNHWSPFFSKLQEKKNITINGWEFKNANFFNSTVKTNIILGVSLRYTNN